MPNVRSTRLLLFALVAGGATPALAQKVTIPAGALASESAFGAAVPRLARHLLGLLPEATTDRDLESRFPVEMAAGEHGEAIASIEHLTAMRLAADPVQLNPTYFPYAIAAGARLRQERDRASFPAAFQAEIREVVGRLGDKEASRAWYVFRNDQARLDGDLRRALEANKDKTELERSEAVDLIGQFERARAWRSMAPLVDSLAREDDLRRYSVDDRVLVSTPDGASIAVILVRPRSGERLPALLGFTIYADDRQSLAEARRTAAYGYVGVVAYSRGKGRGTGTIVPYERDGDDARAVIDWISRQSWSDGRVGMYGGSYNGFTQWAAAKNRPAALKAIMPSVPVAPGIDVPMQGNVFFSFVYPWGPYVASNPWLDEAGYNDRNRWWQMQLAWYTQGRPYQELEQIDGKPNPVFARWLEHPAYDAYWQGMIPYRDEFAAIDIPVLTTTGYYDGSQVGALYYFQEHQRYRPNAEHYLVIGPWDHPGGQRQSTNVINGYPIDSAARINIQEQLRYSWFDYVFRGGKKPAILADKVNYEVMGANLWKHAPSVDAMAGELLRFWLTATRDGDNYRLASGGAPSRDSIPYGLSLKDRDENPWIFTRIVDKQLNKEYGLVFESDPLPTVTEVSGLFSGRLEFVTNKRDLDIVIQVYQRMPNGEYFTLNGSPAWQQRLSYAGDRSVRRLLSPGARTEIDFRAERLTSRRMEAGSRIVVVVGVIKTLVQQLNYGTGRDVSTESMADAEVPIEIRWLAGSYLELPIIRQR